MPPLPGVFSAFGLLVADTEHHATHSLRTRLDAADPARIADVLDGLMAAGAERLARDGFPPERRVFRRAAQARYVGQSSEIEVPLPDGDFLPTARGAVRRGARAHLRFSRAARGAGGTDRTVGHGARFAERPRLPDAIPPVEATVPTSRRAWFPDEGWIDTPVVVARALAIDAAPGSADRAGI